MGANLNRLRTDAERCRDLASTSITGDARDVLSNLAAKYEEDALVLERTPRPRGRPAFHWPLP